jgi:hypothetical protein
MATEAWVWQLIIISTEVQNEFSYTFTPPQLLHSVRGYIQKFPDRGDSETPVSKYVWKLLTSTQLHVTWHTDSQDMVMLPYTSTSRYHNL